MPDDQLMLSISGLRGVIGKSLDPFVATRYAAALGLWFQSQQGTGRAAHVVVGRDSRPSGDMIERAVIAGLIGVGCRVTSIGIATTPGTAIMTGFLEADGGVEITASHNPIKWNGIKTLRHDGVAPPPDQAQQIIDRYRDQAPIPWVSIDAIAPVEANHDLVRVHTEMVLPQVDAKVIQQRRPRVVLDSVHGAGGPETAHLLDLLDAEVIHLYAEPTGQFPHTPEPTRENLTGLCDAVREHGADIGLAQDPDADRIAIVDETGRYIGEEYTLALCAMHVLDRARNDRTRLVEGPLVTAANLSTSRMLDDIAAMYDASVIRTPVGEANVAAALTEHNGIVGGEGNGGIILPSVGLVRDSLVGAGLLLEMLAVRDQPLSQIVDSIPAYAIVKDKVEITPAMKERFADVMRDTFGNEQLDEQDGVRVDWPDQWVHVRPSNTEPILRIIAEAPTEAAATERVNEVRKALGIDG